MNRAYAYTHPLKAAALALAAAAALALPGAPAEAMTFSPPTFDFIVSPGQTVTDAIKIRNDGTTPTRVTASTVNFRATPGDETEGTPEFYPADEAGDGHGLAPWMQVLNGDLTLAAGDSGSMLFEVRVPLDASPGSYFGAVVVRTEGETAPQDGVGVRTDTALLVLLRVQGEVVEDLKLTSFMAKGGPHGSLPVEFEARVENAGTVHLRPYGEITIKDMLGRTAAIVPVNRQEYKSVLPSGARRYPGVWTRDGLSEAQGLLARQWKGFGFGRYVAELSMTYGEGGAKSLTAAASFWVVPWAVIAAGAALIAAAWLLLRAGVKRWKKAVIRQFEKEKTGKEPGT